MNLRGRGVGAGTILGSVTAGLFLRVAFLPFSLMVCVPLVLIDAEGGWPVLEYLPLLLALVAVVATLSGASLWFAQWLLMGACAIAVMATKEAPRSEPRMFLGLLGFVVLLRYRRQAGLAFLPLAIAYVALGAAPDVHGLALSNLDDAVLSFSMLAAGALLIGFFEDRFDQLGAARQGRIDAKINASYASAWDEALSMSRALLHDDIIGTLVAVGNARGCETSHNSIRASCRRLRDRLLTLNPRAVDTLRVTEVAPAAVTSLTALVDDIRRDVRLIVPATEMSPVPPMPPVIATAVRRGLLEALRNVERHAGVPAAEVQWSTVGQQAHLFVIDRGRGGAEGNTGWGRQNSLENTIRTIGGEVAVRGTPGGGTTVHFQWPIPNASSSTMLHNSYTNTVRALDDDKRIAVRVTGLVTLGNVWLGVRYSWGDTHNLAEITLLSIIVATSFIVARRLQTAALEPIELIALGLGAAGIVWVGLQLAGEGSLVNYNSWVISATSVPVALVCFYSPGLWVAAAVLPMAITVLAEAQASGVSYGDAGGAISASLLGLLGYFLGAALRDSRAKIDEEESLTYRVAQEAYRRQVAANEGAARFDPVRRSLVPWLQSVAEGDRRLSDPATWQEAHRLAIAMRDELAVPGVLDDVIRHRIAEVRAAGVTVEILEPEDDPVDVAPCLRLFDRCLDYANVLEHIEVQLATRHDRASHVTVTPHLDRVQVAHIVRGLQDDAWRVEHDTFATTVHLLKTESRHF